MRRQGRFGRLMDRIAANDEWSRALVSFLVAVVVIAAIWVATGIFWLDRAG